MTPTSRATLENELRHLRQANQAAQNELAEAIARGDEAKVRADATAERIKEIEADLAADGITLTPGGYWPVAFKVEGGNIFMRGGVQGYDPRTDATAA